MKSIMKILWFIIKLPFRILALVVVAPLSILEIMINLISNMGGVVLSLFNIFMLIGFFGIIELIKDSLLSFALGSPYGIRAI